MAKDIFVGMGERAHEFEMYLDYKAKYPEIKVTRQLLKVIPLEREDAFHKGVDYFVEVFVFYGILGFLGVYELRRGIEGARMQKE